MYCIRRAFLRLTKSCLKLYLRFLPLAALYEYKSYNYRRDRSKAHGDSDAVEAEIKHAHKQISERNSYNYRTENRIEQSDICISRTNRETVHAEHGSDY